jgi:RNA binding exosome subunit
MRVKVLALVIEGQRIAKNVELSVFAHATENEEKVKTALRKLLSPTLDDMTLNSTRLTGHYDDPIIMLTLRIQKRKEATEFLDSLYMKLSSLDREKLSSEVEKRIDSSGNLYIRLDKQKAYNGYAVMQENDPIRVKVKLQVPHGENASNVLLRHLRKLAETEGRECRP